MQRERQERYFCTCLHASKLLTVQAILQQADLTVYLFFFWGVCVSVCVLVLR